MSQDKHDGGAAAGGAEGNQKDNNKEGEEALVKCGTSKGDITLRLIRKWSPHGYDKAASLFERHYYDHSHFFRVVPGFLVQFGITYSTDESLKKAGRRQIADDPPLEPKVPFEKGVISFAGSGPSSRTSQLFISYGSSDSLGTQLWETPIGRVEEGMEVVEQFFSYGDMPPWGKGPVQGKIHTGPEYIESEFPKTDRFGTCSVQRIDTNAAGAGEEGSSLGDRVGRELSSSLEAQPNAVLGVAGVAGILVIGAVLRFGLSASRDKARKST